MQVFPLVLCAILHFSSVAFGYDDNGPTASTNSGELLGKYMTTRNGRKFSAFLSIPFAKPPVGELRFKPPVPPDPWPTTRTSTHIHGLCPQRDIYRRSPDIEGDEDCLYLNVYTPQMPSAGSDPLPVMVFFHGGGWLCGAGNSLWYGPDILLDRDVVLVVTNYRLGALGFLSTEDDVVSGNNGMKDQTLALRWVKDNIRNFGGDPDSVTLFGESAGGASAHYHTLSPLSRGLFNRAIAQSGTSLCTWTIAPKGEAVENAKKLAKALKCPTGSSKEMVECLRKVDAGAIVAQDEVFMKWDFDPMIPFKPIIEKKHDGAFLYEHPVDIIESGRYAEVPLMLGFNHDDGALRAAAIFGNPHLIEEINNDFNRIVPISLLYDKTAKPQDVPLITKKLKEFYFKNNPLTTTSRKQLVDMYTDGWFFNCIDETIRLHKKQSKQHLFLYLFAFRGTSSFTEIFGDPHNDYGVCHADDLQYLFPVGDGLFPDKKQTEEEKRIAEIMTSLWVNFATSGNPTPETNEIISEKWLPVKTENLEYYNINTTDAGMKSGLFVERAKLWRSLPWNPRPPTRVKDEF